MLAVLLGACTNGGSPQPGAGSSVRPSTSSPTSSAQDPLALARNYVSTILHVQGLRAAEVIRTGPTEAEVTLLDGDRAVSILQLRTTPGGWVVLSAQPGTPGLTIRATRVHASQLEVEGTSVAPGEQIIVVVEDVTGRVLNRLSAQTLPTRTWSVSGPLRTRELQGLVLVIMCLGKNGMPRSILTKKIVV